MKNITFNDSTVLREFARLSVEKGLIKEAAPVAPQAPAATTMPSTKVHAFDEQLLNFPILNGLNKGQRITDGAAFLKELGSSEFKRFKDGWMASVDVEGKNKLNAFLVKVLPLVKQLQAQVKKMSPQHQQAYAPVIENTLMLLSRASVSDENIKVAEEKLYDVSGETGKDLVDAAHPGGGTATELTHSKTKENLVETIVEQQEADLEVVRKVPKGTYATLMGLYNKLSKLGLDSKLSTLKNDIVSIATDEEVVEHTLITLADDLDKLGYAKYANGVDGLLKKKIIVANEVESLKETIRKLDIAAGELFIKEMTKSLSMTGIPTFEQNKYVRPLQALTGKGFAEAYKAVNNIFANIPGARRGINNAMSNTALVELMNRKDKLRMELKQLTAPQVVPPRPEDVKVVPPDGKAGRKTLVFNPVIQEYQRLFNEHIAKDEASKLVEDGLFGPKTKEMWDLIGDIKELRRIVSDRAERNQETAQPQEAPATLKQEDFAKIRLNSVAVKAQRQLMRELENQGVDFKTTGGRDALRDIKTLVWQAAQKAENDFGSVVFKSPVDKFNQVYNATLAQVKLNLTPEVIQSFKAQR